MKQQNIIPDRQTCLEIIAASDMLPNIKKHSQTVSYVAVAIARRLNADAAMYDLREIEAAGLLHDITKTRSLTTGENHSLTGAEAIAARGYHSVADIIGQHVTPINGGSTITAAEIVSYADKRVLHDRIVSLHERFDYLKTRYGKSNQDMLRIDAALQRTATIEKRIADKLPGGMKDLLFENR